MEFKLVQLIVLCRK